MVAGRGCAWLRGCVHSWSRGVLCAILETLMPIVILVFGFRGGSCDIVLGLGHGSFTFSPCSPRVSTDHHSTIYAFFLLWLMVGGVRRMFALWQTSPMFMFLVFPCCLDISCETRSPCKLRVFSVASVVHPICVYIAQ